MYLLMYLSNGQMFVEFVQQACVHLPSIFVSSLFSVDQTSLSLKLGPHLYTNANKVCRTEANPNDNPICAKRGLFKAAYTSVHERENARKSHYVDVQANNTRLRSLMRRMFGKQANAIHLESVVRRKICLQLVISIF